MALSDQLIQQSLDAVNLPAAEKVAPVTTDVKVGEKVTVSNDATVTTKQAPVKETPPVDRVAELLKELNIKSVEELKEKVKPTVTKSKDQELSESLDYGIRSGKIKMDDYNEAVKLAAIPPKELVFKKFSEKQKELNPKITDAQIQSKFNRKYGEEIETKEEDENGNPVKQIVFDESEIDAEAKSIIKSAWQPIKDIQKDYSDHTTQEQQKALIQKEAQALVPQIPTSVKWKVGESDFEYTIDDTFKKQIEDKVVENYIGTRELMIRLGHKSDEQFDVAEATRFIVQNECFNNILSAHAATFANQRIADELQPFKNSTTEKQLEIANQGTTKKPITESAEQIADRFAKSIGR